MEFIHNKTCTRPHGSPNPFTENGPICPSLVVVFFVLLPSSGHLIVCQTCATNPRLWRGINPVAYCKSTPECKCVGSDKGLSRHDQTRERQRSGAQLLHGLFSALQGTVR